MKKELRFLVDTILDSKKKTAEMSLEIIKLAEQAFDFGDIQAYSELMDEVVRLNPQHDKIEDQEIARFLSKDRIGKGIIPDIDMDVDSSQEVFSYLSEKDGIKG